jgi:plastocyanin
MTVVRIFLFLALAAVFAVDAATPAKNKVIEIKLIMSEDGAHAYFDPPGVHIHPGDTVRWVQVRDYHSVSAYHPSNGNHELRIPNGAEPWNSDILLGQYPAKGSTYEHRFTIEGVYDYFCQPHEAAGMVGRIIVGKPGTGPGTRSFGYAPEKKWNPVPSAAQKQFPAIAEIMRTGLVPAIR